MSMAPQLVLEVALEVWRAGEVRERPWGQPGEGDGWRKWVQPCPGRHWGNTCMVLSTLTFRGTPAGEGEEGLG